MKRHHRLIAGFVFIFIFFSLLVSQATGKRDPFEMSFVELMQLKIKPVKKPPPPPVFRPSSLVLSFLVFLPYPYLHPLLFLHFQLSLHH